MQEDEKQDDSGNAAKEDPTGIVRQAVEKRYQQGTRKTDPRFGERVQQHVARGCRKIKIAERVDGEAVHAPRRSHEQTRIRT